MIIDAHVAHLRILDFLNPYLLSHRVVFRELHCSRTRDFFCEREGMSGYSAEDLECTLESLAGLESPKIFIVVADVNPYKKEKPLVT